MASPLWAFAKLLVELGILLQKVVRPHFDGSKGEFLCEDFKRTRLDTYCIGIEYCAYGYLESSVYDLPQRTRRRNT